MDIKKHLAAQTGYELYLSSGQQMALADINQQLTRRGLPEVSERTFGHYRRMAGRGQYAYMPINEFDMAVKAGRFRDAS